MNSAETNLTRYLELENLLNGFFAVFDYCYSKCIKSELEKSQGRPVAACCRDKYYCLYDLPHPAFERLREEREKRYGKPQDQDRQNAVSPCEYHDPFTGCRLGTHKSPICLAFFCRKAIDYLRTEFGDYTYDYLGFNYALEWVLTGDLSEPQYREFRDSIIQMVQKVTKTLPENQFAKQVS